MDPAERARARGAWISLLSQITAAALAYALSVVLARALGTAGFGVYASVLAWISPLALLASLGLPTVALRFLPAYRAERDHARLAGFLRAAERLALAGAVAISAAGSALALLIAPHPSPWLVGLWTLPLTVQLRLCSETARAAGRFESAFFLPLLQPLAMLAGAVLAAQCTGALSPTLALALPAVGVVVVHPWQRAAARRIAPDTRPIYETRTWLRVGLGVLVVDAAHLLLSHADAVLLGALQTPRAVALFSAASATAAFSMFPMIAVGASTVPSFASLWALGRKDELERLAQRAVLRAFTAQVLLAALVIGCARPLLALYGGDFADARVALLFVLAGQLANTGAGYVGSLMSMTGHQDKVGRSIWLAAALNVALVIAGTSRWGVTGAAAGSALSSLGWNVWLYCLVRRHLGVRASFADALLSRLHSREQAERQTISDLRETTRSEAA
jgi:O-antigen/teichoic acid export membrane protein